MKYKSDVGLTIIANVILTLTAIICIVPFITVISISLTPESIISTQGFKMITTKIDFSAYKLLFKNSNTVIRAYEITAFVTVVGTFLSILTCSQFAYILSRKDFILKKQLSFYLFFTMLFSGGVVPWYILITKYLGMKDSLMAIILPMLVSAWNIFLLKAFFRTIPDALIEAAKIDGANEYYIFYRIVLPLAKSGIATVSIFIILSFWNDWYNNMLFIVNPQKYSLQYLLQSLMTKIEYLQIAQGTVGIDSSAIPQNSLKMATCVVAAGPMIFVFSFFQKYFVKGITVGSVKE